jgi:hypothetical protein
VPFVRFSRDRRGYEHVYLVDTSAERGGRSRVLFWFRTPPGVKVGRSPFDAATQRCLEQQNPGVRFDWPQIVAARMPPPAPVENWREKRRAERAIKRARAAEAAEAGEAGELDRSATQDEVPVADEPDEGASALDDSASALDDAADELPDFENETAESAARTQPLAPDEPVPDQVGPSSQPAQTEAGAAPRRGRRRRRRHGRRPADRPGQGEIALPRNGRLDPAGPPPESSDEH